MSEEDGSVGLPCVLGPGAGEGLGLGGRSVSSRGPGLRAVSLRLGPERDRGPCCERSRERACTRLRALCLLLTSLIFLPAQ